MMTRTFNRIVAALVVLMALASTAMAQCPGNRCRRAPVRWAYRVAPAPAPPSAVYGVPAAGTATASVDWLTELNAIRARHGLAAVAYDPAMVNDSAINNGHQAARGLGHFHMGQARRQNAAMGTSNLMARWMASPGHRAAILDPSVRFAGLAASGTWATLSLR